MPLHEDGRKYFLDPRPALEHCAVMVDMTMEVGEPQGGDFPAVRAYCSDWVEERRRSRSSEMASIAMAAGMSGGDSADGSGR